MTSDCDNDGGDAVPFDVATCVVLVPVSNRIEPVCEIGLRELERLGYVVWRVYGYSAIDQARCQLATDALRDGFEWLMWIDADIEFTAEDVHKLAEHRQPFMSALYAKKGHRSFAANFRPDTKIARFGNFGEVIEMAGVGFGFVLTHRDLYAKVQEFHHLPECNTWADKPLVPYFMPMVASPDEQPAYLPEDLAFCARVRQAGIQVLADTRIRLGHVGAYSYSWEDAGQPVARYGDYIFHID